MSLKLGLALNKCYDLGAPSPYKRMFDLAQLADDLGFDSLSVPHHSFSPNNAEFAAPFTFLAAIAAITSRIKLATSIYILPLYHPVVTAEQIGMLDQISGGRVILGFGAGYRPYEFEGFGVDLHKRGERMNEFLKILRDGWTNGYFEADGKHVKIPRSPVEPIPIQKPHPPIFIGGSSEAAIKRAATLGDAWHPDNLSHLSEVCTGAEKYRHFCAEAKRPVGRIHLIRNAWIADTTEEVERDWLPKGIKFHMYYRQWSQSGGDQTLDPGNVFARIKAGQKVGLHEFAEGRAIVGTPDDCIESLKRYQAATGCESIHIFLATRDFDKQKRLIELFGREVIPALRYPSCSSSAGV